MDINNNQQINTFTKGMNTDVSDMLMDSSQYRYAENVRLVTNTDGNSGELRVTDGTEYINQYYFDGQPGGTITAMTSIRDVIIVASEKSETVRIGNVRKSLTQNTIAVYDTSDNKGWVQAYRSFDEDKTYSSDEDIKPFGHYLSLVTRYENEKLIKLYIADGENQLMYINLAPYIKYTGSKPDPIEGIDNISMNVEEFIQPIKASISTGSGNVPGVKVQYAYRYYKLGGAATQISPLSNPVAIYKDYNEGYTETDKTTSKAVDLKLPEVPQGAGDKMQIYRISYVQVGQLPAVNIIYDSDIMSDTTYTDTGSDVQSVDVTEFLSTVKFTFIPKIIESKNNYLFAANIKYIQSDIDATISDDDIRCLSSGDYSTSGDKLDYNRQFDAEKIMTYDPSCWNVPGSSTLGGDGTYISWKYNIKVVAIDRNNVKYNKVSAASFEKTTEQLNSLRQGEVYRYGAILYDNQGNKSSVKWIADIMSPMLKDINGGMFPSFESVRESAYGEMDAKYFYYVQQIGIDFTIKSLPPGVAGIEIVRANRTIDDRITITEGCGGFPYRIYHKNQEEGQFTKTQYICPTGHISTDMMYADSIQGGGDDLNIKFNRAISDNEYLMFSSPEYVYQSDDIKNIIKEYKSNIEIDTKYNMHQRTTAYADIQNQVIDYWGIQWWVEQNGGTSAQSCKLCNFSIGGYSEDAYDLRNSPFFLVPAFIPNFITQQYSGKSDSISNLQYAWCYTNYVAYRNTWGKAEGSGGYEPDFIPEDVNGSKRWTISAYVGAGKDFESSSIDQRKFSIEDIGYTEVPSFDSFFGEDENKTNWQNSVTNVGSGTVYSNWSAPLLMGIGSPIEIMKHEGVIPDYYRGEVDTNGIKDCYPVLYPTGSTGKCMVIHLDKPMKVTSQKRDQRPFLSFPLIRLRKNGATPYKGVSTIKNSTYISHGNMINHAGTISVFDGDCYPGLFVYNASHAWYEPNTPCGVRQASVYIFPVESDVDLSATWGDTYNKLDQDKKYYFQDKEADINGYIQENEAYRYNTAYGIQPTVMSYNSTEYTSIDTSKCDTRVHHSQPKTNGEHIDNWLNFKALDFTDVDSRYGEITNMRLFKDSMLYWQNTATGLLSINERTVLNDASDNQIILGTGDVLQRYDYISTMYGMLPNQYEAETQSNSSQYFWDGQNKELLAYTGGMELAPLTKLKSVISYINSATALEHPSLSYDNKFNELIASVVNNGSIVYNEQTQCFTSVYTFNPTFRAVVNDRLYYMRHEDERDYEFLYRTSITKPSYAALFDTQANPKVRYTVNNNPQYNKVFDITTYGGRFYGGDNLSNITFDFNTPLKQHSQATGSSMTNREYDFRLAIPRNNGSSYGDRMRGKTMQCELASSSNSTDFSLQYIITKYRMSWS